MADARDHRNKAAQAERLSRWVGTNADRDSLIALAEQERSKAEIAEEAQRKASQSD
jgi:hypothetical protein